MKSSIPTQQDFALAKSKARATEAAQREIKQAFLNALNGEIPCHDAWVWLSVSGKPVLSFIFPTDNDLFLSEQNGARQAIEKAACGAFRIKGITDQKINYHSHELVKNQFNGNYNQYFR